MGMAGHKENGSASDAENGHRATTPRCWFNGPAILEAAKPKLERVLSK